MSTSDHHRIDPLEGDTDGQERGPARASQGKETPQRRSPNYSRRRMAAVGVMVTILILVGAAGWIATHSESDEAPLTRPTWNAVIEAARNTGDLLLMDPEGAIIADAPGQGLTSAVFTFGDRLGVLGPNTITLRSTNLATDPPAEEEPLTITLEAQWSLERFRTQGSLTFLASPPTPGNLLIIDGSSGDTLDIGSLAGQRDPVLFPDSITADATHRIFAVGDGRNFQTIVVGFDLPGAAFFPGVPIAISSELVITATTVGTSSELGVFSVDGQRLNSIATERPVGTLLRGRSVLMVGSTGTLATLDLDTGDLTEHTSLMIPAGDEIAWAAPGLDHQRLIVAGGRFMAVVGPDGAVIAHETFSAEQEMEPGWVSWRCWPVGTLEDVRALIDLRTGETVATVSASIGDQPTRRISVNADGCAVHLSGAAGQFILTPDTRIPVPITVTRVVLSPDARAAIMVTNDARARLITLPAPDQLNGLLAEGVDLGIRRGILAFTTHAPVP